MLKRKISLFLSIFAFGNIFYEAVSTITKTSENGRIDIETDSANPVRRPLRIAQVVAPWVTVPPKKYGGTERVAYFLIEELVRRGHNVTLFATTDSNTTSADLFTHQKFASMKQHSGAILWEVYFLWIMEQLRRHANDFDVFHFHTAEHFGAIHAFPGRTVSTIHSKIDWAPMIALMNTFTDAPFVSISNDQRIHAVVHPRYAGTVYHGIPQDLYKYHPKAGGDKKTHRPYLAVLGRLVEDKAPDMAIRIAVEAGIPLKLAGIVVEKQYWAERVKPLIEKHAEMVEYIGEINDTEKDNFLGNALAMLFTSEWAEPFGLVMIETLACGTPVVGRNRGSVPEIVDEGVTGILFNTFAEGVEAVKRVGQLDRSRVRRTFEKRFSVEAMVDGYEQIYGNLMAQEEEESRRREQEQCRT